MTGSQGHLLRFDIVSGICFGWVPETQKVRPTFLTASNGHDDEEVLDKNIFRVTAMFCSEPTGWPGR